MMVSAAAAAASLAAAAPAGAAQVLNVDWNSGCGKTTCFDDNGAYRQSWSSHEFSGPVTIGQILMQRGVLGALDGKTFTISFSLNGVDLGTWGHYNMGGIGGDELNFWGQDFTWNPEDGDLVLTLLIDPPPKPGGGGFSRSELTEDDGGDQGGGGDGGGGGAGGSAGSIVDQIPPDNSQNDVLPSAVPEPAAWALMIGGFGLAGATLRRRRALAA